jgi:hypothetical protein
MENFAHGRREGILRKTDALVAARLRLAKARMK